MKIKRMLFVGYMWTGSTCVPRYHGLKSIGLDMEIFDATGWNSGASSVSISLAHRLYCTTAIRKMNEELIVIASRVKPDAIWLEKANWIYPFTLRRLKVHTRKLIHYNTDDIFATGSWFWLHRAGVRFYDLHLTTNRLNVLELKERFGVKAFRVGMGYDQGYHRPAAIYSNCLEKKDVIFIGHWEPHTERYIHALREAGICVHLWGHNWWKAYDRSLRSITPLPQFDYVRTISSAKIALCVLSRRNRNESTGRSFEIPAIGTFMLAERTLEHEYLYEDGSGAALFTGERELVEKARYYLAREKDRSDIAARGHARCITLGLSWGDHIRREWPLVEDVLLRGKMSEGEAVLDQPFWSGYRAGMLLQEKPRAAASVNQVTG